MQTAVKIWNPSLHNDNINNTDEERHQHVDNYWDEGNNIHHGFHDSPTVTLSIPNLHCVRIPSHRSCPLFDDVFITLSSTSTNTTSKSIDEDEVATNKNNDTKVQLWSLSSSLVSKSTDETVHGICEAKNKKGNATRVTQGSSLKIDKKNDQTITKIYRPIMMPPDVNQNAPYSSKSNSDILDRHTNRNQMFTYSTNSNSISMTTNNATKAMNNNFNISTVQQQQKENFSAKEKNNNSSLDHPPIFHMSNTLDDSSHSIDGIINHHVLLVSSNSRNNTSSHTTSLLEDKYNHNIENNTNTRNNVLEEDPIELNDNDDNGEVSISTSNGNINNQREKMDIYQQEMRLPCPPLCGASFSNTDGNLIVFHNGTIQNTWSWFDCHEC